MGALIRDTTGPVYVDANVLIYSIERIEPWRAPLETFWARVNTGHIVAVTSELTIAEVLVRPLRSNDEVLEQLYNEMFASGQISLVPVSTDILRRAAAISARDRLKLPDAIHAASAIANSITPFLSNDACFRSIEGLELISIA